MLVYKGVETARQAIAEKCLQPNQKKILWNIRIMQRIFFSFLGQSLLALCGLNGIYSYSLQYNTIQYQCLYLLLLYNGIYIFYILHIWYNNIRDVAIQRIQEKSLQNIVLCDMNVLNLCVYNLFYPFASAFPHPGAFIHFTAQSVATLTCATSYAIMLYFTFVSRQYTMSNPYTTGMIRRNSDASFIY